MLVQTKNKIVKPTVAVAKAGPTQYFVYAILCFNNSVYICLTKDLETRWNQHKSGKGGAPAAKKTEVIIRATMTLTAGLQRTGFKCYAWALMSNHYHT